MKYALYLPPFGAYGDARALANLALDVEQAGWDGFFLWDHVALDWMTTPIADPWVALTAVAMNTTRIRFGTTVTPLARRRPWKLARETVSLDHLSGGRLTLGAGLGGGKAEFEWLGEPADPRELGARLDEALEVLAGLWSAEPFHYAGRYYQVEQAHFLPAPCQQPRIPVWIGGFWPNKPPFRRAARWDGVFPLAKDLESYLKPEDIRDIGAFIKTQRVDDTPFDIANTGFTPGDNPAAARDWVAKYEAAGVTWWMEGINPWRFGWDMQGPWPVEAMRERILQGPPRL